MEKLLGWWFFHCFSTVSDILGGLLQGLIQICQVYVGSLENSQANQQFSFWLLNELVSCSILWKQAAFFSQTLSYGMQNTFWGAFWQLSSNIKQANLGRTSQFCFKEMPWFCCFLWKPISILFAGGIPWKTKNSWHSCNPKNQQLQSKMKQDSVLHKKIGKFCCMILQDGPLLVKTGAITPINGLINWYLFLVTHIPPRKLTWQ